MLPHFACNLAATLSYPPWRKELDRNLHTTMHWEKRIPFYTYVRRGLAATCAPGQASLFPQFTILPVEVQLRILALCPAYTLFQLMHVSSTLRIEASKLFWATPNAAFLVDAYWLLHGSYPGDTYLDLTFLGHAQRVEIDYRPGIDDAICPREDEAVFTQQELIAGFWKSFTQRFPNAKQVIINQNWATPSWWVDSDPVAYPLRALMKACPNRLDIAALVLERDFRVTSSIPAPRTEKWQRSLYYPTIDGGWAKATLHWHDSTLLMPTKPFHGPVGAYQRLAYQYKSVLCQKYGVWPVIIEAIDRYHFDHKRSVPFPCPIYGCKVYITRAGEWSVHAVECHCQAWKVGDSIDFLPDELRAIFKERVDILEEMSNKIVWQYDEIRQDWNEQGKLKRREIQHAWIEQLKHDKAWDTGEKAGESRLWKTFWQQMSARGGYCS